MNLKYIIIGILGILLWSGCQKLDEYRVNPNNVSETHPQLLLTTISKDAFEVEAPGPEWASRMLLLSDGEQEQQWYTWTRGSFGDYNQLRNVQKMHEEAERIESEAYVALSLFYRSLYFYNLTLTFGDIPYSEALAGETEQVYTPAYDTQKQVFEGILNELKDAADLLAGNEEIIEGDIIYNGDVQKWEKLVNSFRLKVLITLSKKDGQEMDIASRFNTIYQNEPIINSYEDNAQLVFFDQLGSRYTKFDDSRYASAMYMDSTFIQRLIDRQDPRLFIYSTPTKSANEAGLDVNDFDAYEGGSPIVPTDKVNEKAVEGNISRVDLRYTTNPVNEPHILLGYPEIQFILAEAAVRGWISSSAKTHYENAIKASFSFYNTHGGNYAEFVDENAAANYLENPLVDFDNANNEEEQTERIITQKYLQFFHQGQWTKYFEQLRTGYPEFLTLEGVTPPKRWMYPTKESQYNEENLNEALDRQFNGNDNTRETPWWLK